MKPQLIAALCGIATLAPSFAAGEGWTQDFEAAKKQAAEEEKVILMDFTGSDWCGWCIKLVEEVFSKDAFKTAAKDRLVLMEVDFPQDTSKLSEEIQKQNAELAEKYAVQGYPTIMLTDAKGRPFAQTGYQPGGPEAYVKHIDELTEVKAARDKSFAEAEAAEGLDKAKALLAALEALPLEENVIALHYGDVIEQIRESDPDDETGFVSRIEAREKFAKFESKLNTFAQAGDNAGALKYVEETLAGDGFEGEQKQQLTLIKGLIHAEMKEYDKALAAMDQAKEIAPESELASRIDPFKERLKQMQAETGTADEPEEEKSE